jgi:hypothetical protein
MTVVETELVIYPAENFNSASLWCGNRALEEAGFDRDDVDDFYASRGDTVSEKARDAYDTFMEGMHSTPMFEDWQEYQLLTRSAGLLAKLVEEKRKEQ